MTYPIFQYLGHCRAFKRLSFGKKLAGCFSDEMTQRIPQEYFKPLKKQNACVFGELG